MSITKFKISLLNKLSKCNRFTGLIFAKINFSNTLVYGNKFKAYKNQLHDKRCLNEKQQFELIRQLLDKIEGQVAFYEDVELDSINSIYDFKKRLPLIDKDIVLNNYDKFLNKSSNDYDVSTTAGTSGKPMKIRLPKNRYIVEYGTLYHHWEKVGYKFHLRGVLRNHKFEGNKWCFVNPITKEVVFNNFDSSDENYYRIYKTLKRYKIKFLHAYPSAAFSFFSYLKNQGFTLPSLKAVLASSENILDNQRYLIEDIFKVKLMGFYGHSEKLVFAANCPNSNLYHVDQYYGFFELIDQDGNDVLEPGGVGEIVGSTYYNEVMPLLRYKTGDFAEYYGSKCPHCDYEGIVLSKILGRWQGDKVYNKDGSWVSTTALNLHTEIYDKIDGLQYRQVEKGKLEVMIIPNEKFDENDEMALKDHFKSVLNNDAEIEVKKVRELIKHKNGKFQLLLRK
ncbi:MULTISPECIES: hypothetical protein [unclassified Carboxylicivirga]|uniref:hypothetical protein n=1 Tax=Carboxylicivirga TaxID=1628153 RepID=UPI003D344E31